METEWVSETSEVFLNNWHGYQPVKTLHSLVAVKAWRRIYPSSCSTLLETNERKKAPEFLQQHIFLLAEKWQLQQRFI
jgi:hypothetical protein